MAQYTQLKVLVFLATRCEYDYVIKFYSLTFKWKCCELILEDLIKREGVYSSFSFFFLLPKM